MESAAEVEHGVQAFHAIFNYSPRRVPAVKNGKARRESRTRESTIRWRFFRLCPRNERTIRVDIHRSIYIVGDSATRRKSAVTNDCVDCDEVRFRREVRRYALTARADFLMAAKRLRKHIRRAMCPRGGMKYIASKGTSVRRRVSVLSLSWNFSLPLSALRTPVYYARRSNEAILHIDAKSTHPWPVAVDTHFLLRRITNYNTGGLTSLPLLPSPPPLPIPRAAPLPTSPPPPPPPPPQRGLSSLANN